MHVIRTQRDLFLSQRDHSVWSGAVGVTIGNFDGMHIGHQRLFSELNDRLKEFAPERSTKVLFTFSPHPRTVLTNVTRRERRSDEQFFQITRLRDKCEAAEQYGIDVVYVPRFSRLFAATPPEIFLREHLFGALRARVVVVGHDWSFGRNREGSHALLEEVAAECGAVVTIVQPVEVCLPSGEKARVSTRLVKQAITSGDIAGAKLLLGRPFTVSGEVIRGDGRGRQLGFPTANLHLPEQILPENGVYVTWALLRGRRILSVTNVGVRPTFGVSRRTVETHLLDWDGSEFYRERVRLEFAEKLRDEQRFSSVDELRKAIARDIEQTHQKFTPRS